MTDFKSIDNVIARANQLMLDYFLHLNGPDGHRFRSPVTLSGKDRKVHDDLENSVDDGYKLLFSTEGGEKKVIVPAAMSILDSLEEGIEEAALLDYRADRIRDVKTTLISYQQEVLFQRLKSFMNPTALLAINTSADPNAENAFPGMLDASAREKTAKTIDNFKDLLAAGGPEEMKLYFEEIRRVAFTDNDLRGGAEMLKSLEENIFFWCISPSDDMYDSRLLSPSDLEKRQKLKERFGEDNYGYARFMIALEELHFRLSRVRDDWRDLLVQVFKNDYGENIDADTAVLDRLASEMGSKGLLERELSGEFSSVNIMKQLASLGPSHLEKTMDHIENYITIIEREVFGQVSDLPKSREAPRVIVFAEPRKFILCDDNLLSMYGFMKDEIEALGNEVYGLMSAYTVMSWPPKRFDGPLPEKARKYEGRVFHADRFTVLDLYATMLDAPVELVEAHLEGADMNAPGLRKMIDSTAIPKGSYQIRIPSDVLLGQDFRIIAEAKRMKKGSAGLEQVYEITVTREDMGMHDRLRGLVAENPHSHMLSRREFYERLGSGTLF